MGDVKFLAFIGAFIGPLPTVIALFAASLLGTIYGIIYLTATKQGRKTPIPFGPFLALGALITIDIGSKPAAAGFFDFHTLISS